MVRDQQRITRRNLLGSIGVGATGLAGCLGVTDEDDGASGTDVSDEFIYIATIREDPDEVDQDFEALTAWVESITGVPMRVDAVQDDSAAINALATGQGHVAELSGGPAWVAWQTHGLEPLVVEMDADGSTSYTAAAWVRAGSGLETVADLEGADSCHTGDLTGAGMLIPTAHLAQEGFVSFDEDDDVTAIRDAVEEFFGNPLVGGGYIGALECLSRDQGDVAFVRTSSPEDFCGGPDAPNWCLDLDEYELLVEFTQVPSHPIMASPEATVAERALLQYAFLELNAEDAGQAILEDVLGMDAVTTATSREHLGPYGELIEILPGIEDHLVD